MALRVSCSPMDGLQTSQACARARARGQVQVQAHPFWICFHVALAPVIFPAPPNRKSGVSLQHFTGQVDEPPGPTS